MHPYHIITHFGGSEYRRLRDIFRNIEDYGNIDRKRGGEGKGGGGRVESGGGRV